VTERIVGVLISAPEGYAFQQRDDIPGIVNPGMICVFSGAVEPEDESDISAALREITEETSLNPDINELTPVCEITFDFTEREYAYNLYKLNVASTDFEVFEGQGLVIVPTDFDVRDYNFTPLTRDFLYHYLKQWGVK